MVNEEKENNNNNNNKEKNGSATPKHRKKKKKKNRENKKTASEDAEKIALLFPFSLQPAEQIKMTTKKKKQLFLAGDLLFMRTCVFATVCPRNKEKKELSVFFSVY